MGQPAPGGDSGNDCEHFSQKEALAQGRGELPVGVMRTIG
jgi:hypothetical protein